jgi:hypothetical protein
MYGSTFFNLSARWGWVDNAKPQLLYFQKRYPLHIVREAGWAPRSVWMSAEIFAPSPEFDIHIVCPVVSCYTNYTIPAPYYRLSLPPHPPTNNKLKKKKNI